MSTHVQNIIVEQGALLLPGIGYQGGVPIELRNGGSLDIGNVAGNVIDGSVTVKSGGVFFFNDNQVLGGTGTITFETGAILDISGGAPSTFFTTATNPLVFNGTNHTVRFAASNITNLDTNISNVAPTYVIAGGGTAANLGQSNLSVTTNQQTAGITLENGILTNDTTSRGFDGPITLNNTNFTVAATRGTSLGVLAAISTTANVQVGSNTAIDFRDKTGNPDRLTGLGLLNPHDGHSQVVFLSSVTVGGDMNVASGTRLAFADPNTNIAGNLNFGGTVLYLDAGGEVNSGASVRGGLTARLTDTSNDPLNRVANQIILGDYARVEMGISGAGPHTITQPFVISGPVNPVDKRTFWVERTDASGTPSVFFSDMLLKPNAQLGFDENSTAVRTNLRLEGNATLVRNHDDYDLRNISKAIGAPAEVTLFAGEPTFGWNDATEYLVNGSNALLASSVDGTIDAGVTVDIIRAQLFFEQNAVLNGVIRAHTAPSRGDAFVVSRSNAAVDTTFSGTGRIELGRSVAANGPEDFEIRGPEVASGTSPLHTVDVEVRVVNDGINSNLDGIVRSNRNNDTTVAARVQVNNVMVEAGAGVQYITSNSIPMNVVATNLPGGGTVEVASTGITLGSINAGANPLTLQGTAAPTLGTPITSGALTVNGITMNLDLVNVTGGLTVGTHTNGQSANVTATGNVAGALAIDGAQATISGNVAGGLTITNGAVTFAGAGGKTIAGPVSLDGGSINANGTVDFGTAVLQSTAPATVAGLREGVLAGSFNQTGINVGVLVKLGPVMAQSTTGWSDNTTIVYTGEIFIPDNDILGDGIGTVAFAENFDDSVRLDIDGVQRLNNGTWNDATGTGTLNLNVGWHAIEMRFGQGAGGAGPVNADGWNGQLGFGIDLTPGFDSLVPTTNPIQAEYVAPLDNGTMNLFRATLQSTLNVAANATVNAGGFSNIGTVTFTGANGKIDLVANGAANTSSATAIAVSGAISGNSLNIAEASDTLSVENLQLGTATDSLTVTGAGNLTVTAEGSGTGGLAFNSTGTLEVNGTIPGTVNLLSGILTGSGTLGSLLVQNAVVAPGNSPGVLTTGSLVATGVSDFVFELGSALSGSSVAGTHYDQINVTGTTLDLGGAGLTLSALSPLKVDDIFTIILKGGTEQTQGFFNGIANASTIQLPNGAEMVISYYDDASTPGFETDPLGGGNDVSLLVTVPEPGSAVLLLGGLGSLLAMRRRRQQQ